MKLFCNTLIDKGVVEHNFLKCYERNKKGRYRNTLYIYVRAYRKPPGFMSKTITRHTWEIKYKCCIHPFTGFAQAAGEGRWRVKARRWRVKALQFPTETYRLFNCIPLAFQPEALLFRCTRCHLMLHKMPSYATQDGILCKKGNSGSDERQGSYGRKAREFRLAANYSQDGTSPDRQHLIGLRLLFLNSSFQTMSYRIKH
jgi:hypothetical protein